MDCHTINVLGPWVNYVSYKAKIQFVINPYHFILFISIVALSLLLDVRIPNKLHFMAKERGGFNYNFVIQVFENLHFFALRKQSLIEKQHDFLL